MILVSFSRFDRTRGAKDQIFRTLDDCQGVDLITLKSYVPIDQFEVCKEDGLIYQHIEHYLKQELDMENYRTMIAG